MPSFELLPGNRLSRSVATNLIAAPGSIAGASISPKRELERTNLLPPILVNRDLAFVIAKGKLVLGENVGSNVISGQSPWKNEKFTAAVPHSEGIERLTSKMSHGAAWRGACASTTRDKR